MKKYIQELRLFGLMILLMVIAGSEGYSQGAREVTGTITDEMERLRLPFRQTMIYWYFHL